jgi:predicted neuraminidase
VTAYLDQLYPSAHAANLLLLDNGDVLCFWFSGTLEGASAQRQSDAALAPAGVGKSANFDKTF